MRRSNSLRSPLQTNGPTPPSLLHSPLLNATTRGPALYPASTPALSHPSSRRPSDSASSVSSASSHASSYFAGSVSSTAAAHYGCVSPHASRTRITVPTESHSPPSSLVHHPRAHYSSRARSSWASPAATSAGHADEFVDDPWKILDTVPASTHHAANAEPLVRARSASTTAAPAAIPGQPPQPSGSSSQGSLPPPLSYHTQIGPYAPAELAPHILKVPTRRRGATILVTSSVTSSSLSTPLASDPSSTASPDGTPVLRNRPHPSG